MNKRVANPIELEPKDAPALFKELDLQPIAGLYNSKRISPSGETVCFACLVGALSARNASFDEAWNDVNSTADGKLAGLSRITTRGLSDGWEGNEPLAHYAEKEEYLYAHKIGKECRQAVKDDNMPIFNINMLLIQGYKLCD